MLCSKELSVISMQLCAILRAGIPIDSGVCAMRESLEDKELKEVLAKLESEVSSCESLSEALKNCGQFPNYMINMVKIGERAGNTDTVFESLSEYYGRENSLRENIRTAVTYPFILILMITAVMAILVSKVLPEISKVLENLGGSLNGGSLAAVNIGRTTGTVSFILVLALLLISGVLWVICASECGKSAVKRMFDKIPTIKKLNGKIGAARFTSVMSLLLSSGCDISEALSLLTGILPSEKTKKLAKECQKSVERGNSFCDALKETGFFGGLYYSMLKIGVKTGTLDSVLKKISNDCADDAKSSLSNLVSRIEPVMIGFLSLVIGCVLVSNLLPLIGIISSVG